VSLEWERLMSKRLHRDGGLRYSKLDGDSPRSQRSASFREWTWRPDGSVGGEVAYQFQLD